MLRSCFALIACIRSAVGNGCVLSRLFSFLLTTNKVTNKYSMSIEHELMKANDSSLSVLPLERCFPVHGVKKIIKSYLFSMYNIYTLESNSHGTY
jgi:hypothetical protein